MAKLTPTVAVLSFKQSLSLFKHVLRTLMGLSYLLSDLRHKHKSQLAFFFFFLANPNLIQIYKFSIYKSNTKTNQLT